jgi:hypothetical protein
VCAARVRCDNHPTKSGGSAPYVSAAGRNLKDSWREFSTHSLAAPPSKPRHTHTEISQRFDKQNAAARHSARFGSSCNESWETSLQEKRDFLLLGNADVDAFCLNHLERKIRPAGKSLDVYCMINIPLLDKLLQISRIQFIGKNLSAMPEDNGRMADYSFIYRLRIVTRLDPQWHVIIPLFGPTWNSAPEY